MPSQDSTNKRRLALFARLSCAAAVAAFVFTSTSFVQPVGANESVRFALNWLVSGRNAGYFVALDKGFYEEEGLEVSISRGNGSGDTIKRVAVGESDFGLADTAAVVGAIANDGSPVVIVGMISSKAAAAVNYREGIGIEAPQDLVGRTIGRAASGASALLFPGFLKANNIDQDSVEQVTTTAASFIALLLAGEVDAVVDQSSYIGRYNKTGESAGVTFSTFRFADFGLDLLGDAIIVSRQMIEDRPEVIRGFMTASLRGNHYAFDHPEEAIAILRQTNPEIDTDVGIAEIVDARELSLTDDVIASDYGYGYLSTDRMASTISIVEEYIGINNPVNPDDVFTLEFLPKE